MSAEKGRLVRGAAHGREARSDVLVVRPGHA